MRQQKAMILRVFPRNIIKHLYEDNISGKLTDERFVKLSAGYEREQDNLKPFIETTRKEIKEHEITPD